MKSTCFFLLIIIHCTTQAQTRLQQGTWRVSLKLNDTTELPFNMEVHEKSVDIINAEERIKVDEISYSGDSVFIRIPVFDAEFRGKFSEREMSGIFFNYARKNKNRIPFYADYGWGFRFFDKPAKTTQDFSGRWEVEFAGDDPETKTSIGEFKQEGNRITGTFLTPTGDYRYLDGFADGRQRRSGAYVECGRRRWASS